MNPRPKPEPPEYVVLMDADVRPLMYRAYRIATLSSWGMSKVPAKEPRYATYREALEEAKRKNRERRKR